MAITVTSLGTSQNKSGAGAYLTYASGFVASAGDWIIVCAASDLVPTAIRCYDASTSRTYELPELVSVNNSGNVVTTIAAGLLPVTTAANDYVEVVTTSTATTITVYKATGLSTSSGESVQDQTTGTTDQPIYSSGVKRVGALFMALAPTTISSVDVKLAKLGAPSGTLYVRLRSEADDSIIGTLGSKTASDLTTTSTFYTFNTSAVVIPSAQAVFLSVEYEGGDASNHVLVRISTTDGLSKCSNLYQYVSSWSLSSNELVWQAFAGAQYLSALDKSSPATGSSTAPSSGATETLSQADELVIGAIGVEDNVEDIAGSWTTGAGNVSGNEQQVGTTGGGGASNIVIRTAAEVVAATTAQTAAITGMASADWAAAIATFMGAAAAADTGLRAAPACFDGPAVF